jgi:hypothetical protein
MGLMPQNIRKKRKSPQTIQVVGQLADLMLEKPITFKYLDTRKIVVDVYISETLIQNNLIDLGVIINVATKETMDRVNGSSDC